MSYLVFARKWRPLHFEDVVGQEHITDTLKRAIEKDRVAHAYIFTGTRGVGKTTSARILARALNCENGPTPDPCGECASCKSVIAGNSFDVMEIDGASNNGVDQIRELRDSIGYTSMGGKYRIIIIDEVHMLSTGAFNALLKTLEEPPEKVIFIFATTEPHKIPDTIHSRCQRFDFRAISEEQVGNHLKKICTKEGIAFDEQSIALVAHKAAGSMRDSLSLLDQVYSFCGDNLEENKVRSVLGLVSTDVYKKALMAIGDGNASAVIAVFEETLNAGYDIGEFLTGFRDFLRTLLFLAIPGGKSGLSPENEAAYRQVASLFSEGDLMRMSEVLAKAEADLRFSSLPRFTIELALIKLASMERTITLNAILEMVKTGNYDGLPEIQARERNHPEPIIQERVVVKEVPVQTESIPAVEETAAEYQEQVAPKPTPVVEEPVAVQPEATPVVEEPVAVQPEPTPIAEEPVAVQSEPTPVVEEPVDVQPEPTPVVEEPVAVQSEATSVVEEPVAVQPEAAPVAEEQVAVQPEATPVVESPVAVQPEPTPAVEEPVAVQPEPTPAVESPVAVQPEPTPVVESPVTVQPEPTPVVEEAVAVQPEATPIAEEAVAVQSEATPVVEEPVAVQPEATPVVEESVPIEPESAPVTEEELASEIDSVISDIENQIQEPAAVEESVVTPEPAPEPEPPVYDDPMIDASHGEPEMVDNSPVPAPEPSVANAVGGDIRREWTRFLQQFAKKKPVLASWLQLGTVIEVDDDAIDIQFESTYTFQQHELSRSENRAEIEKEIETFSGVARKLHLTVSAAPAERKVPEPVVRTPKGTVAPSQEEPKFPSHHQMSLDNEIKQEPIIQSVLDKFNAEII